MPVRASGSDRTAKLRDLLERAERAHGVYESTELSGVYDNDWPAWYAAYAVDHGLGELLGRDVSVEEVADQLASGFADYERLEPKPDGSWSDYLAHRFTG